MPGMPRVDAKTTKIAYKILGVPSNMRFKKTPIQEQIDKRLLVENTSRIR